MIDLYEIAGRAAARYRFEPDHPDLVQEAAIRLWQVRDRVDGSRPEHEQRAYLYRCARSAVMDYLRWRRSRSSVEVSAEHAPATVDAGTPGAIVEAKERTEQICAALDRFDAELTPRQREVVYDRLGVAPMSDDLRSKHKGTRLSLCHQARDRLQAAFAAEGVEVTRSQVIAFLSRR